MKTKKRILSRFTSLALSLMLALSIFCIPALTQTANAAAGNVADESTLRQVCSADGAGDAVLSANITLKSQLDVQRDTTIDLNGYTLNIELVNIRENNVYGSYTNGILVSEGKKLTITDSGSGRGLLNVNLKYVNGYNGGGTLYGNNEAAINITGANLVVENGVINATVNGYSGAGIGGGDRGYDGGTVIINGGTVTAAGGDYAAGIGGGCDGDGGTVIINGGTVTAKGGYNAAGIGGGKTGSGAVVTIKGGTVTATGGLSGGAGIGSGYAQTTDFFGQTVAYVDAGTVTIDGGTVNATGGKQAAGIGGGFAINEFGGAVTINGGTVNATGGDAAAGIGGHVAVTINGGTVTAIGRDRAAGIGASSYTEGGPVTITGGTVTATGAGKDGAGIGGGYSSIVDDGAVTIAGGTVSATGDPALIGGGNVRGIGPVTLTGTYDYQINNGSVTTTSFDNSVNPSFGEFEIPDIKSINLTPSALVAAVPETPEEKLQAMIDSGAFGDWVDENMSADSTITMGAMVLFMKWYSGDRTVTAETADANAMVEALRWAYNNRIVTGDGATPPAINENMTKYPTVLVTTRNFKTANSFQKCRFPWSHFYICWDGFIAPCCAKPFPKELNFGNVFENGVLNVLNSKKYRNFRTLWYKNQAPNFCNKCHFLDIEPVK